MASHMKREPNLSPFAILPLIALLVTGCNTTGSPKPQIREDKIGESGVRSLATTAESRLVLVKGQGKEAQILAEPSPDVAAKLQNLLDLQAKAAVNVAGKGEGNASFAMVSKAIRDIARLSVRSQGVVLFRDGAYQLAQAQINGAPTNVVDDLMKMYELACEVTKFELERNKTLSDLTETASDAPRGQLNHAGPTLAGLFRVYAKIADKQDAVDALNSAAKAGGWRDFTFAGLGQPYYPDTTQSEALLAAVKKAAAAGAADSGLAALKTALEDEFGR